MKTILVLLASLIGAANVRADPPDEAVKAAVAKAIKRIETGLTSYPTHRKCFSCHHQAVGVMSLTAARERGFAVEPAVVKNAVDFSLKTFRNKTTIAKGQGVGGDSTGVVYMLHTLAAVERPYDDTTAALVDYLLVKQRKDGSWPIAPLGDRPPTMGSLFTNTGLAMFVLKKYGLSKEGADSHRRVEAAIAKGREWLVANKPADTEDKVFHLRGLVDAEVEAGRSEKAAKDLIEEQRTDGSWGQLPHMPGDAYATATVLASLSRAGVDASHEAYQKGVKYLLQTQKEDGAWVVKTRSRPLQVFFDNGDAGGKSQFISFAATNWAVLALLEVLPRPAPDAAPR